MSAGTIIFSRDRAAQLDLLLRSINLNAPRLANPVHVLWYASDDDFLRGYAMAEREHKNVSWWPQREGDFQPTLKDVLNFLVSPTIMCATDDSVFYRPFDDDGTSPSDILGANPGVLCFSLRLGSNTTTCYPNASDPQKAAFRDYGDILMWNRRTASGDFGYAGSLDGHVFRSEDFRALIANSEYSNPNELEDVLSMNAHMSRLETMVSYKQSLYVSIPANRVQNSHDNRFMAAASMRPDLLNHRFLKGERLSLDTVDPGKVGAAHVEFNYVWEEENVLV